jgi:hypothetical protein
MSVWKIVVRSVCWSPISRTFPDYPQFCPEPKDEEEKKIQEKEDEVLIHGRIK